ncbi:MAG TPA: cobalamin biosynthesis protein [Lachnospiraceae bacterium]|nr:cobalamin biosynthesis protein [Lachnospiraceae bacterium]
MNILVTGGSGSGKSAYAEDLVMGLSGSNRIYIATMLPAGEEGLRRIARHHSLREGKGFVTVERYTDTGGLAGKEIQKEEHPAVLLECMSNLTANEIFSENGAGPSDAFEKIKADILRLSEETEHLVIVTNEVFSDGVLYEEETVRYQKILGEINCFLGQFCDVVIEVVYGIPVILKGGDRLENTVEQL